MEAGPVFGVTVALEAPAGSPFPIVNPDIYGTLEWLSSNGFQSVELHLRAPDLVDGVRIKEECARKGLIVSSIGTGMAVAYEGLVMSHPDPDIRRRAVERLKEQIQLGALLNACVIIGSMRGNVLEGETRDNFEERFLESMERIVEHAEHRGVNLVIEAIDFHETNYLNTAAQVVELIDRLGSNRVKVHLDTYHMNLTERDWTSPVLLCGDRLGHVHVADNNRNYPGWGHIDFGAFLNALRQVAYRGSLTIECYPDPDGYTAALKGRDYLRSLL